MVMALTEVEDDNLLSGLMVAGVVVVVVVRGREVMSDEGKLSRRMR